MYTSTIKSSSIPLVSVCRLGAVISVLIVFVFDSSQYDPSFDHVSFYGEGSWYYDPSYGFLRCHAFLYEP